jgi:hypothetical protein
MEGGSRRGAGRGGVPVDATATKERKWGVGEEGEGAPTGGVGVSAAQKKKKKEAGSWAAAGGG